MKALDDLLADYEKLIGEGEPQSARGRKRDVKRVREAFKLMTWICHSLIANEQPKRGLCGYCNTKGHAPFCVVAGAKRAIKL